MLFGDATCEPVLQLGATTEFVPRLLGLHAMSAPAGAPGMSAELARGLQIDMLQRLGEALLQAAAVDGPVHHAAADVDAVLPTAETCRWLQATVTVPHSFERLVLLIHPSVVAELVPRQVPAAHGSLDARRAAIGGETVRVEAWLGEARLTLRDFASLRTGDVLVLETNQPAYLTAHGRTRIATVQLGRQQQRRAVGVGAVLQATPAPSSQSSDLHNPGGS